MAGPGIRYWELAKALSKNHEVTLLIRNEIDLHSDQFKIARMEANNKRYFMDAEFVISLHITPEMAWMSKKYGVKIIFDAYDPVPFEHLEKYKDLPLQERLEKQNESIDDFNFSLRMADYVICANDNQADLWSGVLLSLKKIVADVGNNTIQKKVYVVPFGLSSTPPVRKGESLKSLLKLKESDKVVLWGGCISNWFDPLSLIHAMDIISKKRSDVHLVFMGVYVPDVPEGSEIIHMAFEAQKLAKELNLIGKTVHFNQQWIPYDQRTGFLLDADIGISTHFDHMETRYAFRTRILDYLWAGLPIINTEGDSFSRLIDYKQLGLTVPYKDPKAISAAILKIIDNPTTAAAMKANVKTISEQFYWENVVKPIEEIVALPRVHEQSWVDKKDIIQTVYRLRGPMFLFQVLWKKIVARFA